MLHKWTEEETIKANDEINKIVEQINSATNDGQKLSPLEKFILAYIYVSEFAYNKEADNEPAYISRDVEGIYSTRRIVCYGYAVLLSRICEGIGIPCLLQGVLLEKYENFDEHITGGDSHENNLVFLKDEKYGIDGIFYTDVCWDALEKYNPSEMGNPNPNYKKYNWCLLPFTDPEQYDNESIKIIYKNVPEYSGLTGIYDFDAAALKLRNQLGLTEEQISQLQNGTSEIEGLPLKVIQCIQSIANETMPITSSQFFEALKVVEQVRGLSKERAEASARQTMRYNAVMSGVWFKNDKCQGCFSKLSVSNPNIEIYEPSDEQSGTFKI